MKKLATMLIVGLLASTCWPQYYPTVATKGAVADGDVAIFDGPSGRWIASGSIIDGLRVGIKSAVGANLCTLTGVYTGLVATSGSVVTGTVSVGAGALYMAGFSKSNAYGSVTMSVAGLTVWGTAQGTVSNYFYATGTATTNVCLGLYGDGTHQTGVSNVYVRAITNGNVYIAGKLYVGTNDIQTGTPGVAGPAGPQGPATIAVAWTSNGAAGSAAVVTNVGTTNEMQLGFVIPAGSNGATGATGAAGSNGVNGANGTNGTNGTNGSNGVDGVGATVAVAWTSNGTPGSVAVVTNVGTTNAASFGFIIPTGSNGAAGATGSNGVAGSPGVDGLAATIAVAWTSNSAPGSAAVVTNKGTVNAAQFGFILPQGSNGANGAAATVAVAWTSNGTPGGAASVTNVGTTNAASLGFVIPAGSNGAAGAAGAQGPQGPATIAVAWTSNGVAGSDVIVTNVGTTNEMQLGFVIPVGSNGATGATGPAGTNGTNGSNGTNGVDGAAATVAVAWTSNGAAGSVASVTNVGTTNAAEFGFVIPVGSNGATGAQGPAGTNGTNGSNGTNGVDGAAATIAVAWTSNGVAGSAAVVTNVGTTNAAEFGFVIPVGSNGATGATGPAGTNGTNGSNGTNGVDGAAATIAVAWTSNGTPGSAVIVTNVGTTNAAEFGFVIPVGSNGATGATGPAGTNGTNGSNGTNAPLGITDADAYRGDWGANVSNRVAVLETNTLPLQSGLNVSNRVAVLETNTAPLQAFLSVSNVAAAALPKTVTNALDIQALQIRAGATNGGILFATNAAGQMGMLGALAANAKLFINAGGTAPEYARGMYVGSFTFNSATVGATTGSVTGVGFKPSSIIFIQNCPPKGQSIGVDDGAVAGATYNSTTAGTVGNTVFSIVCVPNADANYCLGKISSFNADGFSIVWSTTGSPTGSAVVYYIAFR